MTAVSRHTQGHGQRIRARARGQGSDAAAVCGVQEPQVAGGEQANEKQARGDACDLDRPFQPAKVEAKDSGRPQPAVDCKGSRIEPHSAAAADGAVPDVDLPGTACRGHDLSVWAGSEAADLLVDVR
mmetsp:Transcript_49395/g.141319  ORF Transcript_49395/g.141319 Transcript_49395/m.141319 type:complete len:127 (-) Transcript_49395:89-469(-)